MLRSFHLHPQSLGRLFFTQMWERFSFYGLNAILVLFMTKVLHISDSTALIVFGSYISYIYLSTTVGGILADRLFGYYRIVFMGGIFILCGHLFLAVSFYSINLFYLGLGVIATGTGLLKPNVSVMVGKLYNHDKDLMRVEGFNIFYMGINIGGFIAPILVGFTAQTIGWHFGFMLSAIGMFVGLIIFYRGRNIYPHSTTFLYHEKLRRKYFGVALAIWMCFLLIVMALLFALLIANPIQSVIVISGCAVGVIVYIAILWRTLKPHERKNVALILVLSIFSLSYWSLSNQAMSSLPLFIDQIVNRTVLGFEIPSSSIFGIYGFLLIVCAPLVSVFWFGLNRIGREPSYALKFAYGLLCVALAFVVIILGINQVVVHGASMGLLWVVGCYLFLALGDLCISPNGMSLVTLYAPSHLSAIMMSLWLMINAFAGFIGAILGQFVGLANNNSKSIQSVLLNYQHGFIEIAIIAIFMTLVLFMLRNKLDSSRNSS
jgi:POT family proton-dependent oligopeptide transporter